MKNDYCIGQYKDGKRIATISGCGRNKGTWDSAHSRRTPKRYAQEMNAKKDGFTYKAESNL